MPESFRPGAGGRVRRYRRLLFGLSVGLGILLLPAAAGWVALPFLVRHYVLQRLEQRFSVSIAAAEIDAGPTSVTMRDVRVGLGQAGLSLAKLEEVGAEVDLWALLRGQRGIRRVVLREPRVEIRVPGEETWGELVRSVRQLLRGPARPPDGGGPSTALEVAVRDLSLAIHYGEHFALAANVPRLDYAAGRRLGIAASQIRLAVGPHEVLRVSSASTSLALRDGSVAIDDASVTGVAVRWERAAGEPLRDAPPYRVAREVQRLLRVTRRAWFAGATVAGAAADGRTAGTTPACRWPVRGTIDFTQVAVDIREPRFGPEPLASRGIRGRLLVERCGDYVHLAASGDGGLEAGGWSARIERTPAVTTGKVELLAAQLEALVRRAWPGRHLPALRQGAARIELAHRSGEAALRIAGELPVPQVEIAAVGRRLVAGPQWAPFEIRIGPLVDDRCAVAGKIELASVAYEQPSGPATLSHVTVQLEPETLLAGGLHGTRIFAVATGRFAGPVRLATHPPLFVQEPELRVDLTFRREAEGRVGFEGSLGVHGIYQPVGPRLPPNRVELTATFDPGTWVHWSSRQVAVHGRILADGLRVEHPRLPLVLFGPPGIRLAVGVLPGDRPGRWTVSGEVGVGGLTVDSPKVARQPVSDIAFDISGTLTVDLPARQVALQPGRARIGAVEMGLSIVAALRRPPAFRVVLAGSRTRCQDLLEALPLALRADLPGLEFAGSADFHLGFDIDFADLSDTVFDLQATSRCRVVAADPSIQMSRLRGTFRYEIVLPDGRTKSVVTGPGSPGWVPLSEISRYMVAAVITTEDPSFFRHSGVSIRDLRAAIVRDLRTGSFAYGGSTIDMQVVKNVFLYRDKTIARKLQEIVLTWWMNLALTKEQILELYLNLVEYGPGIYGIAQAAHRFFGRTPADLSPLEAIYLAKVLPDPIGRYRMYERGVVPTSWRARLDRLLGVMHARGELDEAEYQAAINDRLDFWYPGEPLPQPRYGGAPPALDASLAGSEADPASSPPPRALGSGYPGDPDL